MKQTIDVVRVRHSMLIMVFTQIENYLACMERGYLGEIATEEEELFKKLKTTMNGIEKVLNLYFTEEIELLS